MSRRVWSALLWTMLSAAASVASAQSAEDPLSEAQRAYASVDYARTLEFAEQALLHGGYGVDEMARVYRLLGVAAAALGQEDRAREAYVRLLAIDPDAQVDRDLAPQMRSPFMEARGYWATQTHRLGVDVEMSSEALRLRLHDPLAMASAVVIRWREPNEERFVESRWSSAGELQVPVEAVRVEVVVHLVDAHGNTILARGTESDPLLVERAGAEEHRPIWRSPILWSVVGGVVIAASVTTGVLVSRRAVSIEPHVTFGVQ